MKLEEPCEVRISSTVPWERKGETPLRDPISTKRMTTERHIKLGRQTTLTSFLLGTAIFGLYFLTSSFELLFLGYGFIALTGLINVGILISILVKANKDRDNCLVLK